MGARDFGFTAHGLSAEKAYNQYIEADYEEYGSSSGFRQKQGLRRVSVPETVKTPKQIEKYIEGLLEKAPYDDKYAPAFYIEVKNTKKMDINEISGVTITKPAARKGSTQWKTIYVVSYVDNIEKRFERDTQKEALDCAKVYAEKGFVVSILIEKKMMSKTNQVAVVKPKYKKVKKLVNTYYFFGWVPE